MSYLVYIIYSESLKKFYIGFTADEINVRLRKHNANHKGFTGAKADWVVKYTEVFATKAEAMKREKQIKGWKSRAKIEKLVSTK